MQNSKTLFNIKHNFREISHPESPDFLHLDLLRFIASMGIVFFHYSDGLDFGGNKNLADIFHNHLYGLRVLVDMFFMISGFIICAVYGARLGTVKSYFNFLKKRIARLGPLHWATLVYFLFFWAAIVHFGIHVNHMEIYDPSCIIPNILFLHSFNLCNSYTFNGVSWSISAEMGMYMLAPLFIFISVRWPYIAVVLVLLIIAGLTSISPYWLDWAYDFGVIRAIPSFLLGMAVYNLRDRLGWIPKPSLLFALSTAAFFAMQPFYERLPILAVGYLVVIFAVAADFTRNIPDFVRRHAWLGRLTYSTYMLHGLIYGIVVKIIATKVLHLTGFVFNLWVLITVCLALVVALLSLISFEMPAREWMSSIGKKHGKKNAEKQ